MREQLSRLPRAVGARFAGLPRPVPFGVMLVLLALGASGLAGRSQVSFEGAASDAYVPYVIIAAIIVGAVTMVTTIAMSGSEGPVRKPQLRLVRPIVLAIVGLTIAYFIVRNLAPPGEERMEQQRAEDVTEAAPLWSWGIVLAFLALLGALFLFLVYLRRSPRLEDADALGDLALAEQVAAVIAAGRAALRSADSTRAAVIACFADMESALARAGVERRVAETPGELLERATRRGLLSGAGASAATDLAGLYHLARFSAQALPATVRDDAERAIGVLHDEFVLRGGDPNERIHP